jgi:hypothetical protein
MRKIDEVKFVAERANPESSASAWRWIPDLRQEEHPGMTIILRPAS